LDCATDLADRLYSALLAKAGDMANDIITEIDDEQVHGLTLNQAAEKMRGLVNTKIKLTIMRKAEDKPIDVTIVHDVIRVKSVRFHNETTSATSVFHIALEIGRSNQDTVEAGSTLDCATRLAM
jgi:C-terminal processing protease CtpA/Prc